jgi:hypothetical protein
MSLVMADQESRGVTTDDSGVDEECSVMRENLAEGGGAVNEVGGMEADDLLCSRNAHDQNVLVRRAHSRIGQPTL